MAAIILASTTIESLVAETARQYMIAERALATPQTNVTMSIGVTTLTISASLPFTPSTDSATGQITETIDNGTPNTTVTYTSDTVLGIAVSSLADALVCSIMKLDAMEAAKINSGTALPTGIGSSYSFANGIANFTAVLPIAVTLSSTGAQVITATSYVS